MSEKKSGKKTPQNPSKNQRKKAVSAVKKTAKKVKKFSTAQKIILIVVVAALIAALAFAAYYYRSEIQHWFQQTDNGGASGDNSGGNDSTDNGGDHGEDAKPSADGRYSFDDYLSAEYYGATPVLSEKTVGIYFVNVGQGSSLLLIFDDGTTFLADAGCTAVTGYVTKSVAETNLLKLLAKLKIQTIDYVMATHPDADHVNLLSKLYENYQINCSIYNDIPEGDTTQTYTAFRKQAEAEPNSVQMRIGETGFLKDYDGDGSKTTETITGGGSAVTIYAPGYNNRAEGFKSHKNDKNSMSPICIFRFGGRKLLFTGDSTVTTEAWFLKYTKNLNAADFDVDVLFVGHHGSETSSSAEFLDFIRAEYAVISAGAGNSYQHPRAETMNKLKQRSVDTYRTDTHGTITLLFDDKGEFGFLPETRAFTFNNTDGRSDRMLLEAA